jgi:hypothetical protein
MAKNLTVPVLVGGSQDSLQRDYRINSTPTTYLLGEKGQVLFHQDGYKPGDEKILEDRIAEALIAAPATATAEVPTCVTDSAMR